MPGLRGCRLKLLQREDARVLLLSPKEVMPWLEVLEQRFRQSPEGLASLSLTRPPDEAVGKVFVDLVYGVAEEMAASVFTPARRDQLKAQLQQLRRHFSDGADPEALAGVHGAFMAAQTTTPGDSHFLVSVCWMSLRATMEAMAPTSMDDGK